MKHKKRIFISISAVIVLLIMVMISGYLYKSRNELTVIPSENISADNVISFYQKDDLWKDDALGSSKYHMGDSGCLTTCIASQLIMQNIFADDIPDITPGTLNKFFSENNVYDSEGNLSWDTAGSVLNVEFISLEMSEVTEKVLENLIKNKTYPITCVKMPKSGNYHFVLLIGCDKNSFLCMDPLNKDNKIVPLSEYNNKIYSVRYCENKNEVSEIPNKTVF